MQPGKSTIYPGVPDELLPLWTCWQLPSATLERCPDRSALERFAGEGLALGVDASDRESTPGKLATLERLRSLAIDGPTIPPAVLDAVGRLTRLQRLHLANVRVDDLSFLEPLTELEYLAVDGLSRAPSLAPVAKLSKLTSLGIGTAGGQLDCLEGAELPRLRCLLLRGSAESRPARIETLQPLAAVGALEYLVFTHGRTEDGSLSPLQGLPRLRTVVLGSSGWWNAEDVAMLEANGVRIEYLQ